MFRIFLVITVGAIRNLVAADFSGKWTGTMDAMEGKVPITNGSRVPMYLNLNQHGQGVSGTVVIAGGRGQLPIRNAQIHSDELNFEVHDNANRTVTFHLALMADLISGEASVGDQISKVTLRSARNPVSVYRVSGTNSAPVLIHKVEP
jgi:hypothetical protein